MTEEKADGCPLDCLHDFVGDVVLGEADHAIARRRSQRDGRFHHDDLVAREISVPNSGDQQLTYLPVDLPILAYALAA